MVFGSHNSRGSPVWPVGGHRSWRRGADREIAATVDSLIASTALVYDLTIVTRNIRDFEGIGANLLNPWEPT